MLETLIFDVDGTLADTEEFHRRAFNAAFERFRLGWSWSAEEYGRLLRITGGKERIMGFMSDHDDPNLARDDVERFVAGIHKEKTGIYTEMVRDGHIKLRPGVRRIIDEARAMGLRLAIATTTTPDNLMALLQHSLSPDSYSWFDVIGAGDVVAKKKPAPDIYFHAIRKLGVAPDACLALEDSRNGLEAALAAGVPTLVTVNRYTEQQEFPGALAVLDHLGEPGEPCKVLAGNFPAVPYVDIEALRLLHGERLVPT